MLVIETGMRIWIRINIGSWIRIRQKAKIQDRLTMSRGGRANAHNGALEGLKTGRPVVAVSHHFDDEQDSGPN
jgi:hypothetical protein